jgi:hypothetical protein
MTRYFVSIDENGKPLNGSTTRDDQVHEFYAYEVTEEIWNNQGNYQFIDREWVKIEQ